MLFHEDKKSIADGNFDLANKLLFGRFLFQGMEDCVICQSHSESQV